MAPDCKDFTVEDLARTFNVPAEILRNPAYRSPFTEAIRHAEKEGEELIRHVEREIARQLGVDLRPKTEERP